MHCNEIPAISAACERAARHCATIGDRVKPAHRLLTEVVRFFDSEPAARSVTYPATVRIECQQLPGEVEITRCGDCYIRLNHIDF